MTDAAAPRSVKSRSLVQLAALRFRRNRPALGGLIMLALVALFSFAGPSVIGHSYDQVFPSYVSVPPSLEPRPQADTLKDVMEGVATRARVSLKEFTVDGNSFAATVTAEQPIDPRTTRYFDRANEFDDTEVATTEDEGRTLKLTGTVAREYFLFGTDSNGRDLLARVMLGGQISLSVGLLASLVSLTIGVLYGSISGYLGGRIDNVMMRFVEILYSLPFVFLVVGAVEWLAMARLVRGQTLALKRREFVGAAQALGLTDWQIIRRHIIPNTIGPVVVFVTVVVPKVILLESFLSFLGLGVQAPLTSWGVLIAEGANNMQSAPWLLIFPAIFFVVTLFSLNFVGDGLRDALDPKDR